MELLKKHAFTIILVVGTLGVTAGSILGLTLPSWSGSRKQISQAQNLARQLKSLRTSGQPAEAVGKVQELVTQVQTDVQAAVAAEEQRNRQGRKSLSFHATTLDKTIELFPVDRQAYSRGLVAEQYRPVYEKAMFELLDKLNGAIPPTAEEVRNTAQRIENLQRQNDPNGLDKPSQEILPIGVGQAGPVRQPAGGGGDIRDEDMDMPGEVEMARPRPTRTGMPTTGGPAGASSTQEAIDNLKKQRVENPARPLYADRNSFYWYPFPLTTAVPIADMWKSMVICWLHEYVVDAIQQTNQKAIVRRRIAVADNELPLCIGTAAVKRLWRVSIGAGGSINALYAGEAGSGGAAAAPGGFGAGMDEMGEGGAMLGSPAPARGPAPAAATLTGHSCNTSYDVVRFSLTLVVRAEDLPLLLETLQSRPGYTVLEVDLTDLGHAATLRGGPGDGGGAYAGAARMPAGVTDESMYYYGTDAVLAVNLDMEARLNCKWERPLMPKEMLQKLPASALRPEDNATISGQDPSGAAGAEAAGGGWGGTGG